jgi:hypothetical protein
MNVCLRNAENVRKDKRYIMEYNQPLFKGNKDPLKIDQWPN